MLLAIPCRLVLLAHPLTIPLRCLHCLLALLLPLLAASWLSSPAPAQSPAFAELRLAGGVSAFALVQRGKIASYDAKTSLHVWSAFTRQWSALSKSPGAFVRQANDWALVHDGLRWSAFSSMRGSWETKILSASATIVNPASQRNDSILLVRDGQKLHAFSGFVGRWVEISVDLKARVAVQRHVAIVAERNTLYGLGAFDMRWRSLAVPAQARTLYADSFGALAEVAGRVYGYSAQTRSWASSTLPPGNPNVQRSGDVCVWHSAPFALAWTALKGRFVSLTVGAGSAKLLVDRQLAYVETKLSSHFFSAPLASWASLKLASAVTVRVSATCALLVEAQRSHGYSCLTGSFSRLNAQLSKPVLSRAAASLQDASGRPYLFSAIRGSWSLVPANALAKAAKLSAHAALIETKTGFVAWSTRSGRFVPWTGNVATASVLTNSKTSILQIASKTRVWLFDARSERWLSATHAASSQPSAWRSTWLAAAGAQLLGFGSQNGRLERMNTNVSQASFLPHASSETATAIHARGIWAYSPLPDLLSAAQFPEFRRIWTLGSVLPFWLHLPPRSSAIPLLGARQNLPSRTAFGLLEISPASLVLGPALSGSALRSLSFEVSIPATVSLRGFELAWQALVLAPSSTYLSRSCATLIL